MLTLTFVTGAMLNVLGSRDIMTTTSVATTQKKMGRPRGVTKAVAEFRRTAMQATLEEVRSYFEELLKQDLGLYYAQLRKLALGEVTATKVTDAGNKIEYPLPPDRYSNIYLIDRLLGKPATPETGPVAAFVNMAQQLWAQRQQGALSGPEPTNTVDAQGALGDGIRQNPTESVEAVASST